MSRFLHVNKYHKSIVSFSTLLCVHGRNIDRFDWIAVFDVDEAVVGSDPDRPIVQQLERMAGPNADSVRIESFYFPAEGADRFALM